MYDYRMQQIMDGLDAEEAELEATHKEYVETRGNMDDVEDEFGTEYYDIEDDDICWLCSGDGEIYSDEAEDWYECGDCNGSGVTVR